MTIVFQPLTNGAYGFPRGAVRRMKPFILAVIHETSSSVPIPPPANEWHYANRPGSVGPSATLYIGQDGNGIRALDANHYAAWSQGDVNAPNLANAGVARLVALRTQGHNPNEGVYESIENCAFWQKGRPITDAQIETCAQVVAAASRTLGIAPSRTSVLAHGDLNGVDRANCPSAPGAREATLGRIIARANALLAPARPARVQVLLAAVATDARLVANLGAISSPAAAQQAALITDLRTLAANATALADLLGGHA